MSDIPPTCPHTTHDERADEKHIHPLSKNEPSRNLQPGLVLRRQRVARAPARAAVAKPEDSVHAMLTVQTFNTQYRGNVMTATFLNIGAAALISLLKVAARHTKRGRRNSADNLFTGSYA